MPCSGRTQRSGSSRPRPSASTWARESRRRSRAIASAITAAVGAARPLDDREQTPSRSSSCSRVSPVLRRNPSSACGGRRAARALDLLAHRLGLGGRLARDQRQPPRRRIGLDRAGRRARRLASSSANIRARSLRARACIRAGISSDSNSSRKSAIMPPTPYASIHAPHGALGEVADAADIGLALGDRDHAARLQRVEHVAGLDRLLIGRDRQLRARGNSRIRPRPS